MIFLIVREEWLWSDSKELRGGDCRRFDDWETTSCVLKKTDVLLEIRVVEREIVDVPSLEFCDRRVCDVRTILESEDNIIEFNGTQWVRWLLWVVVIVSSDS